MRSATLRVVVTFVLAVLIAGAAGEAWARAGSGGSRGSRSYSSPARPAPTSPGTPASPSRSLNNPAPSPRPGLFGGGLMGALGGFMLGGLLGSLLFGGLGGLGSGLGFGMMDILLIGAGLFLLFRFMKSRQQSPQPQPAYAGGAAYAGGGPRPDVPSGGGVAVQEPAPVLDDLERGVSHIRQMDGGFEPAALASEAAQTFVAVQAAVTAGDMTPLAPKLTSEMRERLQMQCAELRRSGHTNHIERIQMDHAEVTEAWQERGRDFVTVRLAGSLVDYTTDRGGAVVTGSRNPERFEEFWTFTRAVGPNAWTLTAIQAG